MNYNDYVAIMTDEELEESELVRVFLDEAKRQQRLIRNLKKHEYTEANVKRCEERKIGWILEAIDTARHEKTLGYKIVEEGLQECERYAMQKFDAIEKKASAVA